MSALKIFGIAFEFILCRFSLFLADHRLRVSGKMESVTVSVLRREADGFTAANGHKDSRDATACGRVRHRRQSTRAPGPTGCRMAMARKRTRTEVRKLEVKSLGLWRFDSIFNSDSLSRAVTCLDVKVFIV